MTNVADVLEGCPMMLKLTCKSCGQDKPEGAFQVTWKTDPKGVRTGYRRRACKRCLRQQQKLRLS